ncbi:MAG: FGGY-family carbohydrate kinase [Pelagibacterium sp.]|uniref:FGGY-family carbohydrate kinase n=1 Tax=Pelagibacterium sp. TaxID=1967288 RepID=UPI0032EF2081
MKHIGVIDIGKTNAKFAVVDAETLAEIAVRTQPNTVLAGPPYPHFDVAGIWTFLTSAIADLNALHPLDALSITTHGATAALVDAAGELTLPVLDYEHSGPDAQRAGFDAISPLFASTLSPCLPGGLNLGAQLFYQKAGLPEAIANTHAILMYPQYWAFRLTGVMASELTSLGCHTGLWDFGRNDFSGAVDAMGLRGKFPPIRSAFERLGPVRTDLAEELGLADDVPVFCGIHDSNASLLPHVLASEPPFSVVSTGTWVVVCSPGGAISWLDEKRDSLANIDALGRTIPSARFMGGREFSQLTRGETRTPSSEIIARVLRKRMMLLPSVQNGSGPFPNRHAQWARLDDATDPDVRYAIVSFYLAMMTAECLSLTGASGHVVVEGPFARNLLYLAMLAAATDRRVLANAGSATGTSTGAALLALGANTKPGLAYAATDLSSGDADAMAAYASQWRSAVAKPASET